MKKILIKEDWTHFSLKSRVYLPVVKESSANKLNENCTVGLEYLVTERED